MKEDNKRQFDALASLRDHAWAEFVEKTRLEWRLSFGLWAGFVAIVGGVLSAKQLTDSWELKVFSIAIVGIVTIVHLRFLLWIQSRLMEARDCLRDAQNRMCTLADHPTTGSPRSLAWGQPALWVQLAITLVFGSTLIVVVFSLPLG